jgi:serine/threonine-protein phosphatase 2B regulatory subunit
MGVEASINVSGTASSSSSSSSSRSPYSQYAKNTHFTEDEVKALHQRYESLSKSRTKDGKIDVAEFQKALGIRNPEFAQQIFRAFDVNRGKNIDFEEFLKGLSATSKKATLEEKARFCFKIYDINRSGYIVAGEMRKIILLSVRGNHSLSEADAQKTANDLFKKFDASHDGKIHINEFITQSAKFPQVLNFVSFSV